jgi:hypothetical protein
LGTAELEKVLKIMIEKSRFVNTLIFTQLEHLPSWQTIGAHPPHPSPVVEMPVVFWLPTVFLIKKYTVLPIRFQRNLQLC